MSLSVGLIGLPNVGKSTLFNALTSQRAETANYPFCTIDPNVGIVAVPDERLTKLAEMLGREKRIPSSVRFMDIAGLVKGASTGEGLGNQFLAHVREADVLVHVVRCFQDPDVTHVRGDVSPLDDITTIETELALADLETVTRRLDKVARLLKARDKDAEKEKPLLEKLEQGLNNGIMAKELLSAGEVERLKDLHLLTAKPVVYAANISEQQLTETPGLMTALTDYARKKGIPLIAVSARLEAEVAELEEKERQEFLADFGLEKSGRDRLVKTVYRLLALITLFTFNETEVRAWEIPVGTTAPQAAGKIHSEMEAGFIRADVIPWRTLLDCGSLAAARQQGLVKSEGKEYKIADGDVVYFHFRGAWH